MAPRTWQRTLKRSFNVAGVGLHSGKHAVVQVHPAAANTGIVFRVPHGPQNQQQKQQEIHAHISNIDDRKSQLCTQLTAMSAGGKSSISVLTIEHLMSALTAAGVTNAYVDVSSVAAATSDRPDEPTSVELPILDGSSIQFLDAIDHAGIQEQESHRVRYYKVKKPVQVLLEDKAAWFLPMPEHQTGAGGDAVHSPTLNLSVQVNFEHKGLGTTFCRFILGTDPEANVQQFREEIAPARTFTFEEEIEWMQKHGLALGGSLDNAVVFRKRNTEWQQIINVLNPDGLRFPKDEWTRHKMLDCIGDLGLAGLPLHGYFFATSPGHALTHNLLRELFSNASNYEERELTP
ncbi:Udp-3-o-[3-hydroxymyristoyl] n-acetylglucosamine deacetylase, partial [Globisporangium splendens]